MEIRSRMTESVDDAIVFAKTTEDAAFQLARKLGTGLNLTEVKSLRNYYSELNREPSEIELQTFGQTWSEHCFHKIFKSKIRAGREIHDGIFRSFIARATEEISADWVVSAFKDNAGIVKFDKTHSIAVKVETHNHPSAVEPFGGAATGIGGVIRDILGVWAEPIALTDVLCFGELDSPIKQLPRGVKHARYLLNGVVSGIGAYGNNIGIPTVNGAVFFDDGFAGYTLVFCGCVGLLKNRNFVHSAKPGDLVVLAGSRTGLDGIHGVSFASEKIGHNADELRSAVQIPDPISEEKLKRAVVEIAKHRIASGITDLGGGGLSSAVCETAKSSGCGVELDFSSVPRRLENISPWELWISETQERMLVVVPERSVSKVLSTFEREEVEATVCGKLMEGNELILKNAGVEIGRIDLAFLFNPPLPTLDAEFLDGYKPMKEIPSGVSSSSNLGEELLQLLRAPNIASKERIVRTYDHEVRGATVVKPFQYPRSGPNDAAVLKPLMNSMEGVVISCGLNPAFGHLDIYRMAASAIDEAIRNNICVGGRRIALLDNFAWGDPLVPGNLGQLVRAAEACYDMARDFGTPFISGKDSLYNESPLGQIPPTLVITAIGLIRDISLSVTADFKECGDLIYLVGNTRSEFGGSEYFRLKKIRNGGRVPMVDPKRAKEIYSAVNKAMDKRCIRACHDISQGGLGVALAEMCFAQNLGADITLPEIEENGRLLGPVEILFSESNSRFLVEVPKQQEEIFLKIFSAQPIAKIGTVTENAIRIRNSSLRKVLSLSTKSCLDSWSLASDLGS